MTSQHQKLGIAVIGIGASAGGVAALKGLLPNLPKGSRFAYVVALHMDPTHRSLLVDILEKESAMPVKTIVDVEKLLPEKIYVMPPDHDCTVQDGKLRLLDLPEKIGPRHSIDILFSSLAESYGERSAGIVLSGTGSDGMHGMLAIKTAGGIAIAQDPETSEYASMPQSVIDAGLADLVLPPARIGRALADIMRGSRKRTVSGAAAQPKYELDALLTVLSHKSNCEFSQYKESTLTRRIERRMAVHKLANLKAYTALVKRSDTEAELLFKDILISVTAFFRDEDTFKALRQAMKKIVARKSRGEDVRIWVPGCATGEEVFSIAILLAEALGQKSLSTPVQIFATDIDAGAIAFARRGLYLETSTKTVPSRLLKKYFTRTGGMYQVVKKIRDMVVFARHDLIRDPPYINLDLVSCRNVLIYFRRPLQDRLVPLFHYSLRPGGYLALGLSEGIGKFTHLFEPFNQRGKVFGRIGEVRSLHAVLRSPHVSHQHAERPQPRPEGAISLRDHYRDLVAEAYAPAGVLVNGRFEIVHLQGDVTRFVHLPPGDLNVNVMNMAIAPLNLETRLVLQKAQREHVVVRGHPVELKDERGISRITTIAIPAMAEANAGRHTLLLFEERRIAEPTEAAERSEEDTDAIRIKELEQELIATREQLRTSVEELQSSNEDLQSVNEEYQSTAEELQSANEELQTTNEELQSTNEELRTVNDELKMKSAALESTNMDLENILNTALSGIVVLTADATDDVAVTQVEFFVDGSSIGIDAIGSNGWSAAWNPTRATIGSHTVRAVATDSTGQTTTDSNEVIIQAFTTSTTSPSTSGTVPPEVIETPAEGISATEFSLSPPTLSAGAEIALTVALVARVPGTAAVQFLLNGELLGDTETLNALEASEETDPGAVFTRTLPNGLQIGLHRIEVVTTDDPPRVLASRTVGVVAGNSAASGAGASSDTGTGSSPPLGIIAAAVMGGAAAIAAAGFATAGWYRRRAISRQLTARQQ